MPNNIESKHQKGKKLPRVIILRGAPASGKSTVAHKLSSLLPASKKAYIAIDDLQHCDLRNFSHDKLKLGVYHAAVLCRSFIREGFDIVVDYVFDKDLEFFVEKLFHSHRSQVAACDVQIFYLEASFDVLLKRNNMRESKMKENVLKELFEACNVLRGAYPGEVVVDTNKLSVKATAKAILAEQTMIVDKPKILKNKNIKKKP